MDIGVFGAAGVIGQRIAKEALNRGHRVTGFTRDTARIPQENQEITWRTAQVVNAASVAKAIDGLDVVVNAISAGNGIPDTIANAHILPTAAQALLKGLEQYPNARLIVIGGAGSLEVEPGMQIIDMPDFLELMQQQLKVPVDYAQVVQAHRQALHLYRLSNRNWTYISPSAGLIYPGERTGRFRIGGNQLLVDANGNSDISAEDLAVAVIDEVEFPRHIQRRFTVGY